MDVFAYRHMVGVRAFGRQVDVRFDGWLPFSVRYGHNPDFAYVWRVPFLGWAVTAGRVRKVQP